MVRCDECKSFNPFVGKHGFCKVWGVIVAGEGSFSFCHNKDKEAVFDAVYEAPYRVNKKEVSNES